LSGRAKAEESKPKVPAYIVTFSDMVTLLLTFFVLLLSMASVQDPELFNKGRDSFWQSIRQQGLGVLFGSSGVPYFGHSKTKHESAASDEGYEGRSIDAKLEQVRRIVRELSRDMTVVPSQIVGSHTNFAITQIHFQPGRWTLDATGQKFLVGFCRDLQQAAPGKIYVLGLCTDKLERKQRWLVSARRAKAVAQCITKLLKPQGETGVENYSLPDGNRWWPAYWWGAGPGGQWVSGQGAVDSGSQVLIAVIRGGV